MNSDTTITFIDSTHALPYLITTGMHKHGWARQSLPDSASRVDLLLGEQVSEVSWHRLRPSRTVDPISVSSSKTSAVVSIPSRRRPGSFAARAPTAFGGAAREVIICLPSATMSMQMRIEQGRARAMDQCSLSRRRRKTPVANPNTVCVCMKSMDGVEGQARRRAAKEECEIE